MYMYLGLTLYIYIYYNYHDFLGTSPNKKKNLYNIPTIFMK